MLHSIKTLMVLAGVVFLCAISTASPPPPPEGAIPGPTIKGSPDLEKALKLYKVPDALAQRFNYRLQRDLLKAAGYSDTHILQQLFSGPNMAFPYATAPDLLSKGHMKTLTVLIDFAGHREEDRPKPFSPEYIQTKIYGDGSGETRPPYSSVRDYYLSASQGLLTIEGKVLGWYHFKNRQREYEPRLAAGDDEDTIARKCKLQLLKMTWEALHAYDKTEDFSKYDNDFDGDIDVVNVIYSGIPGEWNTFWWAYRWYFDIKEAEDEQYLLHGKRLNQFVFQFARQDDSDDGDFSPITSIHETGHALGLCDYYDYKPEKGARGGLGGLDMMDSNRGNHNAFSRWLLDWIQPVALAGPPTRVTLNAASGPLRENKAIAIFPGITASAAPTGEFFLGENRYPVGADSTAYGLRGQGVLIWHVDATLDAQKKNFAYDNSVTDRKLIRLMRAGDSEDFRYGNEGAPSDFFLPDEFFSDESKPDSSAYDGTPTGVTVREISDTSETMTVVAGVDKRRRTQASAPDRRPAASGVPMSSLSPSPAAAEEDASMVGLPLGMRKTAQKLGDNLRLLDMRQSLEQSRFQELDWARRSLFTVTPSVKSWDDIEANITRLSEFENAMTGIAAFKTGAVSRGAQPVAGPPAASTATTAEVNLAELEALDSELALANPDRLRAMWEQESKASPESLPQQSRVRLQIIAARWAAKDGKNAVETILNHASSPLKEEVYPLAMDAWANSCPQSAASWYFDRKNSTGIDSGARFAAKVFEYQVRNDSKRAIKELNRLAYPKEQTGALLSLAEYGKDKGDTALFDKVAKIIGESAQLQDVCGLGTVHMTAQLKLEKANNDLFGGQF